MATKSRVVEPSWRIGCGRYVQEPGALTLVGREADRLHAARPFVLGGETALKETEETLKKALSGKEVTWYRWHGFCVPEHVREVAESEAFKRSDVVIGVGGGVAVDAAKYAAVLGDKPVIVVPTQSATCAACAPLSVTYDPEGRPLGTKHHACEVNAVVVDTDLLARQPVRLFLAGVYDALAKKMETGQRLLGKSEDEIDIGLRASYELSRFSFDRLTSDYRRAAKDIAEQKNTKAVSDCVFVTLCVTGVISGLARGSNQTAIAHKIYESLRGLYPAVARRWLHGELVALGLIVQLDYNGTPDKAAAFREQMREDGLETSLSGMGFGMIGNELYEKLLTTSAMAGTTEEEHRALKRALESIR